MKSSLDNKDNDIVIGGMFSMNTNNKIGYGSFGEIYLGQNLKTKEEVAIKFESHSTNTPLLNYESKILKLLQGGGKLFLIFKLEFPACSFVPIGEVIQ